jgi:large subunit ribosomal protein L20
MARSQSSSTTRNRHKKWLKRAKGYRGRRSKVFKLAKEAVIKAGQHAYIDRRKKKTKQRELWQIQLNAAARTHSLTYAQLIQGLRQHQIIINRKVLSDIAVRHPDIFAKIAAEIK